MMGLREHRRRQLFSIEALAKTTGMSTRTIMDIEHGRTTPRFVTIRKLSDALNVDPMEIEEFRRAIGEEGGDEMGKTVARSSLATV